MDQLLSNKTNVTEEEYMAMVYKKTGAPFGAPVFIN